MLGETIRWAWRGSVSLSGAWAPFAGAFLVAFVFSQIGVNQFAPATIPGAIIFSILCLLAAWIIIFAMRLVYAPYVLLRSARVEIAHLKDEREEERQRPRPDWPIREAFFALDPEVLDEQRWEKIGDALLDLLACSEIPAWGRKLHPVTGLGPLEPIPAEFWRGASWSYKFLAPGNETGGHAYERLRHGNVGLEFTDVHFWKRELERRWDELPACSAGPKA